MQSFGSQMWDAGFAIQAILSCNLNEEYWPTLRKAHEFVKTSQVRIYVMYDILLQLFYQRYCFNLIMVFFRS
jgi:squalene cyclase